MSARVEASRSGRVARVVINRPDVGNALAGDDLATIDAALRQWLDDESIRVIVVTASGDKFFCAGADVAQLSAGVADIGEHLAKWHAVIDRIEASPKPVVAALNGSAVGGGLEIALACHRRIAVEGARLGLPELKVGLFPAAGGVRRLTRMLGMPRALDIVLGAELMTAARAETLGLVDCVVPPDRFEEAVAGQAARLAEFEPNAVRATLACARAAAIAEDSNELEASLLRECYDNPRNREVLKTFLSRPRTTKP